MRTFLVDATVTPATSRVPTISAREAIAAALPDAPVATGIAERRYTAVEHHHPLVAAVHRAFVEHRPLVLSPEALWLVLAQGLATHLRLHPEAMRARVVRHDARLELRAARAAMPRSASAWSDVVDGLTRQVALHTGPGLRNLFTETFSTTTDVERTALEAAYLDAFQEYFTLWVQPLCGIPSVTLLGSVDDWRTLRRRVDVIAEFGLARWAARLSPICDALVASALGDVDGVFWRSIYQPDGLLARDAHIPGWLALLFPYVGAHGALAWNPALDDVRTTRAERLPGDPWTATPSLSARDVPSALCTVPVTLDVEAAAHPLALVAGLLGVSQDEESGGLRPELGWAIFEDGARAFLAKLRASPDVDGMPAPVMRLLADHGGEALFDGAWRLRAHVERDDVVFADVEAEDDGARRRRLAAVRTPAGWSVVLHGDARGTLVVASSVEDLFARSFRDGPFYFDLAGFTAL